MENQFADLAVLSKDFFTIAEEDIKDIYSTMTVLGGSIVHACDEFASHNPPLPPISPDWSPVKYFGSYGQNKWIVNGSTQHFHCSYFHEHPHKSNYDLGCYCWAF